MRITKKTILAIGLIASSLTLNFNLNVGVRCTIRVLHEKY